MGIAAHAKWLYQEFGVGSVYASGKDAWLIILARSVRMIAFGTNALVMALFFAALNFTDFQIGLFMTLTMIGDVFLGVFLTMIADKIGRRRVLVSGSLLMVVSGIVFALFDNFWALLLAAIVGVISVAGGDCGPFRALEESILSQLTTPKTRNDVLSWYVTLASLGSCLGTEVTGRLVQGLIEHTGSHVAAYHSVFWVYAIMGLLNLVLMLLLSRSCELARTPHPSIAESETLLRHGNDDDGLQDAAPEPAQPTVKGGKTAAKSGILAVRRLFTDISPETRSVMYKLWFLLAIDAIADGMVPYSLTNYYTDLKFNLPKSTLGDIQSFSYLLSSISTIFAAPLAKRIGLVNTMVFTHVPSSAAVLLFPLPNNVILTVILLFIRVGLNNMDQAPRAALIAAVVKPEERTAVMGITSMLRTLFQTAGPTITGLLAGSDRFWIAFVAAGLFRLGYDFGLWAMFINMQLHKHEETEEKDTGEAMDAAVPTDSIQLEENAHVHAIKGVATRPDLTAAQASSVT